MQLGSQPEGCPSFRHVLIPVRERGHLQGRNSFLLSCSFHGGLGEFILETTPTRPMCFRMSVGFISLLHQLTLLQLGTVPEHPGGCLKPTFLLPSLSPDKHRESSVICSLSPPSMWPDSRSDMVSKLLPALCPKAQKSSGVDQGALRRCLQTHTSGLPGLSMMWINEGNH